MHLRASCILLFLWLFLVSSQAMAGPELSLEAGGSVVDSTLSGKAGTPDGSRMQDLHDGLGYDRTDVKTVYLDLQHDAPRLPNIRFSWQGYKASASEIQGPARLDSHLKIRQMDLLFYYAPLKQPFQLDLGLDVHRLNVDFALDVSSSLPFGPNHSLHKKATQIFPALYIGAGVDLPMPNLALHAEAYYSRFRGRELRNDTVTLRWQPLQLVRIDLGYHYGRLKYETDSLLIDVATKGPYLGLAVSF